ncbi:MAG TPA: alpha/beta hydrolase-fold protein, partial [Candidatus Sericytochromatia bacterium]
MNKCPKVRNKNKSPLKYIYLLEELKIRPSSKKAFLILLSVMGIFSSAYWYLGITPTPELDTAVAIAPDAQLSYQIQSYTSSVMGGERTYGVSLPPNYGQNPQQRYPVIFLLHGGNGRPTDWFEKGLALPVIEQLY